MDRSLALRALLALAAIALAGCPNDEPVDASIEDAQARVFLRQFLDPKADKHALSQTLQPKAEDYAAVFDGRAIERARGAYGAAWATRRLTIAPGSDETELQIFHITTDDLRTRSPAVKQFPGGYLRLATTFKPGVTIFGFRFVKPGSTSGTTFDGLIFVNGHWAYFPKPFHALR